MAAELESNQARLEREREEAKNFARIAAAISFINDCGEDALKIRTRLILERRLYGAPKESDEQNRADHPR